MDTTLETKLIDWEDLDDEAFAIGVMGEHGDTKHLWNPKKPEEVREAKLLFETLTKAGYRAFRLKKQSVKGDQITEFDEKAKRLLFVPPFAGG